MKRRAMLTAVTAVALPGCVADEHGGPTGDRTTGDRTTDDGTATDSATATPPGDEETVVARFDGEVVRPECERESETVEVEFGDGETREYETAETLPYPDAPAEFDRDEVVEYVGAFEHAYVTHDVLCDGRGSGYVFRVGYSVRRTETFDWYEDVTVVFLLRAGGAVSGTDGRGNVWEADIPYDGVVYAVDETGVARATYDELNEMRRDDIESDAPDPLDVGELVAVFERA